MPESSNSSTLTILDDVEGAQSIISQVHSADTGVPLILFDFHAKWCKNCQRIKPLILELVGRGGVNAYSIDIDKAAEVREFMR